MVVKTGFLFMSLMDEATRRVDRVKDKTMAVVQASLAETLRQLALLPPWSSGGQAAEAVG